MDSLDRDQSKLRRRDEALARRLGEALDEMDARNAGECPDGEILAAYAEHGLGHAETEKWESHFASCPRCRKILLVLAASAETPLAEKEVARLGELVSGARAPVEITAASASRARPRLVDWRRRWLAPALGVAAVLAVWLAMRPPWRATNRGASETLVAQAPKGEIPITSAPAEADRLSNVAPSQDRSSTKTPQTNAPADVPARSRAEAGAALDSVTPKEREAQSSLQADKKLKSLSNERDIQPPPVPPPPAPPSAQAALEAPTAPQAEAKTASGAPAPAPFPQARAQSNAPGSPAAEVPPSASQAVTVTEAAPQVETANGALGGSIQKGRSADLPANGRNYNALATIRPAGGFSALLKAPSGSTLWRSGKGGVIERSTDAGKTWVSQMSPVQEEWLAGAAVSNSVCWLAGRNGAIARTSDGEHWERIAPPSQAAGADGKLPDWTAITARDGQSATIIAGDGRRFDTQDGGKTWQLR
jgi:hypothetical protein